MKVHIRDRLCKGAKPDINEDTIGSHQLSENVGHAWVLDGVTGLGEKEQITGYGTDSAWFSHRLSNYFQEFDLPFRFCSAHLAVILSELRSEYIININDIGELPAYSMPSASGLHVSWSPVANGLNLTGFWFADCIACLRPVRGTSTQVFGELPREQSDPSFKRFIHDLHKSEQIDEKEVWNKSLERLRQRRSQMNTPDGYWIFGLEPKAAEHVKRNQITVSDTADLLLMSDGFSRLVDTYQHFNFDTLIDLACSEGLSALYDILRSIEENKENRSKFPRIKEKDDASAILISIEA